MHAAQEFTTAVGLVVNCTRKLRSGIWPFICGSEEARPSTF